MIASTVDSVYDVQCMCGYGIASSIFKGLVASVMYVHVCTCMLKVTM